MKQIINWFRNRRQKSQETKQSYTMQQMENAFMLGYNDGKRDGLAIARQQALKSLKEILWAQNQNK